MPDAPFITGSDIISNPGNAALGYSSGVAYGGNPNDTNPLAQVDSTLGKLQDEEAQFQVLKYQRRLHDQDELAKMLAETKGSAFNVAGPDGKNMSFTPLPEDKKILDQKAEEYRKAIIANPQGYKYDAGILKMGQDLDALKNHASQRAIFATATNSEAAKTNDQEDRQGMVDNLNQEVYGHKLTDFVTPSPYLNKPGWTDETFHPKDVFNKDKMATLGTATKLDDQGDKIEVNKMGYPIDKLDIRSNITPGNQKIWSEANNMLGRFTSSKYVKDPNFYIEQNAAIDRFNQERGLVDANGQPISQHAIPHIADVTPDGTIVPNKKLSLQDFVYAMTTPSHGATTDETKLITTSEKIAQDKEGIKKSEADIADAGGRLALAWWKAHHDDANEKERIGIEKSKNEPEEAVSDNAVATVLKHMDATRARSDVNVRPLTDVISTLNPTIASVIQDNNINPAEYDVVPLNSSDQTLGEIAGVRSYNPNGTLAKAPGAVTEGYYLRSKTNPRNDRYIAAFNETRPQIDAGGMQVTDDKGKVQLTSTPRISLIDPAHAAQNTAAFKYNESGADKAAVAESKSGNKMNKFFGDDKQESVSPVPRSTTFKGNPIKDTPPPAVLKLGNPDRATMQNGIPFWKVKGVWVDENGNPVKK